MSLRGRRWSLLLAAAAGAGGLVVTAALVPAASAATSAPVPSAVQVRTPPNAKPGSGATLAAVSCVAPKACGAAGDYVDSGGNDQVMVVAESNGRWSRGRELKLPKDAPRQPSAAVNSISCTGPGACVAGGSYEVSGQFHGWIATESHGTWGRARKIGPPPAAPRFNFVITAVACSVTGSCVAVGGYRDNHGFAQVFTVDQVKGTWGKAAKLAMPANADANAGALALGASCALPGNCVTVGEYNDKAMVARAFAATESGGTWHRAAEIALPAGASTSAPATATAVSCPAPGGCVAVGTFSDQLNNSQSFTLTENKGHWRHASVFTKVPSNAAANPQPALNAVTCPIPGSCVAVGDYLTGGGATAAFAAFRHGGHWLGGLHVKPPANAAPSPAILTGVSCTTTPFCAAVGFYDTKAAQNAAMGAALRLPAASG